MEAELKGKALTRKQALLGVFALGALVLGVALAVFRLAWSGYPSEQAVAECRGRYASATSLRDTVVVDGHYPAYASERPTAQGQPSTCGRLRTRGLLNLEDRGR